MQEERPLHRYSFKSFKYNCIKTSNNVRVKKREKAGFRGLQLRMTTDRSGLFRVCENVCVCLSAPVFASQS